MNLFDGIIVDIKNQLNDITAFNNALLSMPENAWNDAGEHHMILKSETAYEFGGGKTAGLGGCLYTEEEMLFPKGVYLYGSDMRDIELKCRHANQSEHPLARIVLIQLEPQADEDAIYRKFKEIDYVQYHIHPEGYMARISPISGREPVRIAKSALKSGMGFAHIGYMYFEKYNRISGIKNINVIFVTYEKFDYKMLDGNFQKAEQIKESLNHIFSGLNMDCSACGLKPVCDEVDGLRKLHFGHAEKL